MGLWVRPDVRAPASSVESASGPHVRGLTRRCFIILFSTAAAAVVIVMAVIGPVGWDAQICRKTIQTVRQGADPYAAGMAEELAVHIGPAARQVRARSLYAYSPLTLPLLRLLARLPSWFLGTLFWLSLTGGFVLQLMAGFQLADEHERRWLAFLLPAAAFFPGLITDDAILSGNPAYILYGLILMAAIAGWKREQWSWFYLAVLAASIFKAPMLTLLAFPVLVGKRQRFPAAGVGAAGLLLIAAQARFWPELFREYLATIHLMFEVGHDFGYGPVGILGQALWSQGLPYSSETTVMYLAFVGTIGLILLFFSYQARAEILSRDLWLPVALVGTFLLNPRIMKYDMAAITIPMLLIASRGLRAILNNGTHTGANENPDAASSNRTLILVGAGCFLIPNLMTVFASAAWPVELLVLLAVFALGVRSFSRPQVEVQSLVIPAELIELAIPEEIV